MAHPAYIIPRTEDLYPTQTQPIRLLSIAVTALGMCSVAVTVEITKYQVETRAVIQYIFAMNTVQHTAFDVGLSEMLLENIVDAVCAHTHVKRIILYGSRARGGWAPTSEIDIAIELDPSAHMLLKSEIDEQIRTLYEAA